MFLEIYECGGLHKIFIFISFLSILSSLPLCFDSKTTEMTALRRNYGGKTIDDGGWKREVNMKTRGKPKDSDVNNMT